MGPAPGCAPARNDRSTWRRYPAGSVGEGRNDGAPADIRTALVSAPSGPRPSVLRLRHPTGDRGKRCRQSPLARAGLSSKIKKENRSAWEETNETTHLHGAARGRAARSGSNASSATGAARHKIRSMSCRRKCRSTRLMARRSRCKRLKTQSTRPSPKQQTRLAVERRGCGFRRQSRSLCAHGRRATRLDRNLRAQGARRRKIPQADADFRRSDAKRHRLHRNA